MALGRVDAWVFEQLLVEMAVGAFEGADESALLRPALPFAVLDLVGIFIGRLVMAEAGHFVFQHSGHCALLIAWRFVAGPYGICAERAMSWPRSKAPRHAGKSDQSGIGAQF